MKVTSDDCKLFLVQHFSQNLSEKEKWKRTAKYMIGQETYRDFTHPHIGEVIVREHPMLVVAVNTNKCLTQTKTTSFARKEYDDFISANLSWACDDFGQELIEGDPATTLCDYLNIQEEDLILCGSEQGKDDDDNQADIYFFEDENTGQNYSIFVYADGSWAYESD